MSRLPDRVPHPDEIPTQLSKIIGQPRIVISRRSVPDNRPTCQLLAKTIQIVPTVKKSTARYCYDTSAKIFASAKSRMRRADKGDGFPFVPSVDAEIFAIDCDDAVARVKLTHADETKIS